MQPDQSVVPADETDVDQSDSVLSESKLIVSENLCGANCILVISRLLGTDVDQTSLDALFPDADRPATLLEVKQAAESLGFVCRAVRWDRKGVPEFPLPAIVPLHFDPKRPNHYVVISGRVGNQYVLSDLGYPQINATLPALRRNWDGYALYFARDEHQLQLALRPFVREITWQFWAGATLSLGVTGVIVMCMQKWKRRRVLTTNGVLDESNIQ